MNKGKKIYIETLRIIALFLVFFNHTGTSGFYLYTTANITFIQIIYLSISFISRVAVPIYFMISGGLLIGKEESYTELFKKRILRIMLILILFSLLNYLFTLDGNFSNFDIWYFLRTIYSSEMISSYWYLYYYIGYLLFLPFLRKIVRNMEEKDFFYLFFICFVLQIVLSFIDIFLNTYHNKYLNNVFLEWFFLYPLAGYYFEKVFNFSKVNKVVIIMGLLSIICIFSTVVFTRAEMSISKDLMTQKYMSLFVSIPTFTIYLTTKLYFINRSLPKGIEKIIIFFGGTTFGCYLINEMLLLTIYNFIYNVTSQFVFSIIACFLSIFVCIGIGGGDYILSKENSFYK